MRKVVKDQKTINKFLMMDGFTPIPEDWTLGQFKTQISDGLYELRFADGSSAQCTVDEFADDLFDKVVGFKLIHPLVGGIPVTQEMLDHPLYPVMMAAIHQAMYGKGQRHGGNVTPFMEQPWHHYAKLHGRGFLTGQATKKLEEAASTRNGPPFETEVLGAMVFAGMSVIWDRETQKNEVVNELG